MPLPSVVALALLQHGWIQARNMSEIVVKDELERGTITAPPGRIDLRPDSMVSSVCEAAREYQAGHDIPAQSWSTLLLFNGLVSGIWHLTGTGCITLLCPAGSMMDGGANRASETVGEEHIQTIPANRAERRSWHLLSMF
ncbi:hypothetical protein PAAG_08514 [Paracoccidioides lutzii Pb01]|uniref:Uncharacterized protein n=1 Tax=Paracoccidioides lutzii (strain ATCC MYA-826 / Pb01) TaxID=502779 RepID=C1HCM3_PARBA|nr:hypothetical protein PAAG_08514 [Paracoccidioides lutzii Pb01]EEH38787.1 hypothetical protein PAAG_08514 [Paracoccidioides lutzii Pb01]